MKRKIFSNVSYLSCRCCTGTGSVDGRTCLVCQGVGGIFRKTDGIVTIYSEDEYKELVKTEFVELKKGIKKSNKDANSDSTDKKN